MFAFLALSLVHQLLYDIACRQKQYPKDEILAAALSLYLWVKSKRYVKKVNKKGTFYNIPA